jgi:ABC-2 type transport system permease protein
MRSALAIELAKLLPSRDFRVSIGVYALLTAAAVLSLRVFTLDTPAGSVRGSLLAFPAVWHNAAYLGGWIAYLLYVVALQNVTQEYQFRTNRQNVIDGATRRSYVAGKIGVMVLLAIASTLIVGATAAGFGLWTGEGGVAGGGGARFVALYALQALGYLMLALLVGTTLRKTGAAVLAFIGYTLLAEPLLRDLVLPNAIGRHLPSAVFGALVRNPFFGYAGMRVSETQPHTIVEAALYACVLAVASGWVFRSQDL